METVDPLLNATPPPAFFSRGWVEIPRKSVVRNHCYLCGARGNAANVLQEEHVIPQVIFAHFRPNIPWKYVKLWACNRCNQHVKKPNDDLAVRVIQLCSPVPAAVAGVKDAIRGFERNAGRHIARRIAPLLREPNGASNTLQPPRKEVEAFFVTIAKGLWVRHADRLFNWKNYDVQVRFEQVNTHNIERIEAVLDVAHPLSTFAGEWLNTFSYVGATYESEESGWAMTVYTFFVAYVSFRRKRHEGLCFRSMTSLNQKSDMSKV